MPAAAAITLADGQATPVNHTFNPRIFVGPGETVLINDEALTSAGQMKLTLGFSAASQARPTNRVKVRFSMPVEQTVNGVTSVAYTARFDGDIVLPEQMTLDQRKNMAAYVANALSNATIKGYTSALDPMY